MVARLERRRDELRVDLEVHPLDRRTRGKAGAVEDDELESLRERLLVAPRRSAAEDASVDEEEALHGEIIFGLRTSPFLAL